MKTSSDGTQHLIQSKPSISSETSNPVQLLKTHHSHNVPVDDDNDVHFYTLPKGGNSAVQEYIESASSYTLKCATQKAVVSSFSLMACLYNDDDNKDEKITTSRRLEAVSKWLKQVVSDDVSQDISSARLKGDSYGAVFAALSGGDLTKASSLALDIGHPRLSLMLASSGSASQHLFNSQEVSWNETGAQSFVPSGILRIFSLAGGSVDTEESIFKADSKSYNVDWRRRFGMYIWSCRTHEAPAVASIVKQYRSDVFNGVAPSPTPLYIGETRDNIMTTPHNCVLYEMFSHYADSQTASLASIVSPASHTKFHHDFSASFHLAAALTALTSSSLTLNQEDLIIDSLASQLIMAGSWEWAVYITLCLIGNNSLPKHAVTSRLMRAKRIISMFHTSSSNQKRSFLENLGVPSEWFSAAIAYRSAYEGDVLTYVEHLIQFTNPESVSTIEDIVIPCFILGGKKCRDQLMKILHSFAASCDDRWGGSSLCRHIYDFLCLSNDVEEISSISSDVIENMVDGAATLHKTLSEFLIACNEQSPLCKIRAGVTLAPRYVYLTEVLRMLSNIHLQLLSYKSGTMVETKDCPSRVVFALDSDGLFGNGESTFDSEGSAIRGLCGFTS
jgi:hypothetical protein